MGLNVKNLSYDMVAMQKHKDKVVKGLTMGIEMLFKMNKVAYKKGAASFASHNSLEVLGNDGEKETIKAKNIVIATGSEPSPFPGGGIVADEDFVLTSTGALSLDKVPKSLIVIGGNFTSLYIIILIKCRKYHSCVLNFCNTQYFLLAKKNSFFFV
jgi:dihydrolipoamide dehydrogenase